MPLFSTPITPLIFRSWIAYTSASTPAGLHRLSLRLLPCYPQPDFQVLLDPCSNRAVRPFLPPHLPSGCPPFIAFDVVSVPAVPCRYSRLGFVFSPPLFEPFSPPSGLNLRPGPCRSQGRLCLQFLASCLPQSCFLLARSCSAPYIGVFWCHLGIRILTIQMYPDVFLFCLNSYVYVSKIDFQSLLIFLQLYHVLISHSPQSNNFGCYYQVPHLHIPPS